MDGDARGASFVEYVILVGTVALVGLGGAQIFGAVTSAKLTAQSECVASLDNSCAKQETDVGTRVFGTEQNPTDAPSDNSVFGVAEPKNPELFSKGPKDAADIDPNDVTQGPRLGDCGLMASLKAIAGKDPSVLRRDMHDNKNGTFTVTLHTPKGDVNETVDAKFPTENGDFMYAQPGSGADGKTEIWPMVYERAVGKYYGGSYFKIQGKDPSEMLQLVTGKPSQTYLPGAFQSPSGDGEGMVASTATYAKAYLLYKARSAVFNQMDFSQLADAVEKGPVVAGTHPTTAWAHRPDRFKDGSLLTKHAYWVESVNRSDQSVTLRNPYGWGKRTVTVSWQEFQDSVGTVHVSPGR